MDEKCMHSGNMQKIDGEWKMCCMCGTVLDNKGRDFREKIREYHHLLELLEKLPETILLERNAQGHKKYTIMQIDFPDKEYEFGEVGLMLGEGSTFLAALESSARANGGG